MSVDLSPGLVAAVGAQTRSESPLRSALRSALRRPVVIASVLWVALVVVLSVLASAISPYNPLSQDLAHVFSGPSGQHLLGTDDLGRDILTRLLHGGGGLLLASLESVVIGAVIGVSLGMLAGYLGGWTDSGLSFLINILIAVPGFVILIAVTVISSNNLAIVMAVLGLLFSANFFRLTRATTQAARSLLYVDAARVAGVSRNRTLTRHILPNITGLIVVYAFLTYGFALIIATSLSFLGLGFSPETPNWGQMVYDATQNLSVDPWMMVPVGAVLIFTILSVNFIGSALRDGLPQAQRQRLLTIRRPARRPGQAVSPAPPAFSSGSQEPGSRTAQQAPGGEPLLAVDGLTISFPGTQGLYPVVDQVSFTVERGTTLALVGESGCGKTMTALGLLGLVPPPGQITGGRVMLAGQDITRLSERQLESWRGTRIAMISQEPMVALDPCFTVGSQLMEALRLHRKLSRRQASPEARELLRLMGIARPDAVAKSYPHQISGGMAQRVAIALALSGEPELLIADEPTTALDVTIQAEILDLLRSLQDKLGMTMVIATHDLGVVADVAATVAVMYAGQVVEFGVAEDVLVRPVHPYTRALLGAVPDPRARGKTLATVEGTVPLPQNWPAWCRFADRCGMVRPQCTTGPVALERARSDQVVRCVRAPEFVGDGDGH
jgi:peptide/nickel transport system permease protein